MTMTHPRMYFKKTTMGKPSSLKWAVAIPGTPWYTSVIKQG